jgi:hypothetical protein
MAPIVIAIISKPTFNNQQYVKTKEEDYNEGTEILSASGYPSVQYRTDDNSWKKDLYKLIE